MSTFICELIYYARKKEIERQIDRQTDRGRERMRELVELPCNSFKFLILRKFLIIVQRETKFPAPYLRFQEGKLQNNSSVLRNELIANFECQDKMKQIISRQACQTRKR